MTGTATGEGTGAETGGTGAEAQETGAELRVGGPETGVGGLLQGLLNLHCPVWPHLGLSGQAAAGQEGPCQ